MTYFSLWPIFSNIEFENKLLQFSIDFENLKMYFKFASKSGIIIQNFENSIDYSIFFFVIYTKFPTVMYVIDFDESL